MSVRCLITDGKNYELNKLFVEDTLKYFPDYDFNSMKATISGWQSSQLKDSEDRLPTILELISYLLDSAKRENNNNIKIIADKALLILNNLSAYDKKLQDILANAPRDSLGRLLAHNGKPSNLTERQYAQVRTKEFKDWFGDWENDPANASKVVDENGEPLVVYHGNKDSNITKFVPNKGKYSNKPLYYFSSSKDTALSYATEGASQTDPNDYTIVGFNVDPNTEEAKYADFKSLEDFDIATRSKGRIYEVFLNIRNPINNVSPAYIHDDSLLKGKNNDGMISIPFSDRVNGVEDRASEDIQYVVLSSNQIKSATDNIGTFSKEDDNINNNQIDFFEDNTDVRKKPQIKDDIEKGKDYTIDKLIELFNKYSIDKEQQELAKKVFAVIKKLNFKVLFLVDNLGWNIAGLQDYNVLKIARITTLEQNKDKLANILLHETIHGVTTYAINAYKNKELKDKKLIEAVEELQNVYDSILDNKSIKDEYGLTNVKELVAELANPSFRDKLKKINIWEKLKNAIKKIFFFFSEGNISAHTVLSDALDKFLDNYDVNLWNSYNITPNTKIDDFNFDIIDNQQQQSLVLPQKEIQLSTTGYKKGDPLKNPNIDYVFTENAEAYVVSNKVALDKIPDFPNQGKTKLGVSDVNGTNQAGIRNTQYGTIIVDGKQVENPKAYDPAYNNPNAYGIVVKKYQQNANGRFVAKEGQFQDTDEDFALFVKLNEDMFKRLSKSSNKLIIFPTQMGLGKAALPMQFAEWLQAKLLEEFSILSTIEKNARADYDGYGLRLNSIELKQLQQTLSLLILPESLPITTEQLNEPLLFNEEKIKATRDFLNPVTRKQVVLKIARMFSNIVSNEYNNQKQALDNRIANETDDKIKKELLFLRRKFNRFLVIKTMTPVAIFNKLKETYEKYVNLTDELGKNLEKTMLNKNSVFQKMPDALKDRIALIRFNNKKKAYQLILDNFKILAMEASKSFALTEGVNLTFNNNMVTLLQEQDTYDDEGNSDVSENKEEKGREHWMIDVRTVSSFNSLTNKIRQAINNIARVTKDGIQEVDDMGDTIYLSGSYVHSELIKTLAAEITDPNDIIPILLKAAVRKPWINLIIYKILDDPILFTEMYRAYNKSTLNYWILKPRTLQDGSIKTLTISLNKIEGIDLLFETWRDNYEYGNKLEDDAVYTSNGTIIKDNVKKGLDLVNEVKNDIYYHRKDTRETRVAIVLNKDNVLKLTKAFKMLGIPLEEQTIAEAIGYNIDNTLYEPDFNANTIVNALVTIYDDLLKNKEVKEDELFDMANAYGRALETVAKVISFVTEDTMESQVRHNKKSLYSHVNSGYMINLIKKLKNPDKFKDFIEKEYMPVEWFYKNGLWRNQFIKNLYNNQEDRDKLQHIVMLDYNGKEYADWSTLDSTLVLINQFFSLPTKDEHGWAYYNIPVLSDTESAEFLRMRRYINNFEDIINTKFINLVKLEIDRIDLVKRRANDPNVEKIANFDMVKTVDKNGNEHIKYGGAEFKFFPELNFILVNGKSFLDEYYRLSLTETADKVNQFIKELISSILERRFKTALKNWDKIGLFERVDDNPNGKFKYFDTNSRTTAELLLKQWYWNSSFAQSQIIELLTTDLAFYKTKGKDFLTDFIKRAKEFHAPIERLNTEAEWIVNGERKKVCYDDNGNKLKNRVLYLKDCVVPSLTLEELKEALDKNPKLTKEEKGIIIGAYLNINMADALAYRTLDSFRRTLIMAGQWSDDEETAYNNIKNGNFRLEDITVLWNTRKPYLYTLTNQSNLVDNGNIRVPVLHKNSEMIMLTLAILGTIMSTGKLAALERFMTKNNIDVVMFESAVKAGGLDIIDLNNIEANEVENYLTDYVNTYSLAIHEFDYEDYGIQTATPEHGIDAMLLVGTLIRRIIASNQDITDPNFRFKYKDKEWTVLEWLDYYNMVNTANIRESFEQLDKKFSDIKEIEKLLLSEVRSNPRYDTDVEIALTLNSDGVFNIPLLDPSITYKIQSLLTSIVKNRVTKQKIAGGAFIQTSAWGFKREPKVIYNEDGSVKYIECYMPCPSEELYNMLLDDKTHEVDINKKYKGKDGKWHYIVPEKYRELIGYRVPTESFYSCAPLKVIGYLPRQCGTIMVVPRDIVSMAGSDFDVDKVYAMLHTLKFKREYNIKKAWDDFYESHPKIVEEIDKNYGEKFDEFLKTWNEDGELLDLEDLKDAHDDFNEWLKENGIKKSSWSETALTEFNKWFKENKLTYLLNIIPLVNEYKDIKEDYIAGEPLERKKLFNNMLNNNTKEQRDSLLIDLMWAVLTNKETTPKLMKPGGFDGPKKAARIATILKNNTIQSLKDLGYNIDTLISDLSKLSIELLTDIVDKSSKILNPLTPDTWVTLHDRNMAGAALIAIAATNNAGHALMLHTNLLFKNPILINGKLYQSLHDIKNAEGKYITENIAEFLAAVVDNAKDPVAGDMNLNTTTAGIAFTLLRLGVNATTTALFLSLPIVQQAVDIVAKKRVSLLEAFKELTTQYTNDLKSKGKNVPELKYIEKFNFSDSWLALSILGYNNMSLSSENLFERDAMLNLVRVGELMQQLSKMAQDLTDFTLATRADTQNGGAGPTIADTMNSIERYDDIKPESTSLQSWGILGTDTDTPLDSLFNSDVPILQAFFSYGLVSVEKLFSKILPYYTNTYKNMITLFKGNTRSGKLSVDTRNKIYTLYINYQLSKVVDKRFANSDEQRDYFINKFPNDFVELTNKIPDLKKYEFIKRIVKLNPTKYNPAPALKFNNVGKISDIQKQLYMLDWESLLYINDETKLLALDLLTYNMYRGLDFSPSGFSHLVPSIVKMVHSYYVRVLNDTLKNYISSNIYDLNNFFNQFIRNNLYIRELVPDTSEAQFTEIEVDNEKRIAINLHEFSSSADRKVAKPYSDKKAQKGEIEFLPYIMRKINGTEHYYKLIDYMDNHAEYKETTPLGKKNKYYEYSEFEEIESVIKPSEVSNLDDKETESDGVNPLDNQAPQGSGTFMMNLIKQGLLRLADNPTKLDDNLATLNSIDNLATDPSTDKPLCGGKSNVILTL